MNLFTIDFSDDAKQDINQLYEFMAEIDLEAAHRALKVLNDGWKVLEKHPYTCRKAIDGEFGPQTRELVINFGSSGYVALFEINPDQTVTVLAVRHQRESDYH